MVGISNNGTRSFPTDFPLEQFPRLSFRMQKAATGPPGLDKHSRSRFSLLQQHSFLFKAGKSTFRNGTRHYTSNLDAFGQEMSKKF